MDRLTLVIALIATSLLGCASRQHESTTSKLSISPVHCFGINPDGARGEHKAMPASGSDQATWVLVATDSECRNRGGAAL